MNKYIKYAFALALPTVALTSCDDYLDTMPDNRATIDNDDKIKSLLVSAYPENDFSLVTEISSDNVDDVGPNNKYTERFFDNIYEWKDEIETFNESLARYWESSYVCIAAANQALDAINELGGLTSTTREELYAEALLARAYNHFMLAQLFCKPWTQDAEKDLGLPYMEKAETELKPTYERGNLADFYNKIEEDLVEGLKYVGDSHLDVPKYHFNTKAAYAFAARFYLTVEKWQEAADWATKCIGSQPKAVLRDHDAQAALPRTGNDIYNEPQAMEFIKAANPANLLIATSYSRLGWVFGRTPTLSKYCHHENLSKSETIQAGHPMGAIKSIYAAFPSSGFTYVLMRKVLAAVEYIDIVAGNGYIRSVIPLFTTDEALLNRAEAYIMLKRYDEAAADLTLWSQNISTGAPTLTPELIQNCYNAADYSYSDKAGVQSTIKKHLHPAFTIDAEGSVQETMLQCMLAFRRIENLHFGFRWFDIRRYGIEFPRRMLNTAGTPATQTDFLGINDERRTFQLPLEVRDAGLTPNPR